MVEQTLYLPLQDLPGATGLPVGRCRQLAASRLLKSIAIHSDDGDDGGRKYTWLTPRSSLESADVAAIELQDGSPPILPGGRAFADATFAATGRILHVRKAKSDIMGPVVGSVGAEIVIVDRLHAGISPTLFDFVVPLALSFEDLRRIQASDFDDEMIGRVDAYMKASEEILRKILRRRLEPFRVVLAGEIERSPNRDRSLAVLQSMQIAQFFVVIFGKAFEKSADRRLGKAFNAVISQLKGARERELRKASFATASGYDRYPQLFPVARSLGRRLVYLAGPTNSGKTFEAMRLVAEASSGEVLSPLRLLALEHRDALAAMGIRAGLVTGEEQEGGAECTHFARTIETMDVHREVDVAVIDEIQMLGDEQRGWAWTQALVGVPARLVVMTGSVSAIPLVERIAAGLGEPLEIRRFERRNALNVLTWPVYTSGLTRGDAVIAFSRREVHRLRERIASSGLNVATIYGSLGPEVRRSEAARFRNGEADVLVATDAIGMGLNLPISRVLFSSLEKFDGFGRRRLDETEIHQISGRAGRFGMFEHGEVGVFDRSASDLRPISEALGDDPPEIAGKAYVRPNRRSVELAAEYLGTDDLHVVLDYLRRRLVQDHPDLRMADMSETMEKVAILSDAGLSLLDRFAYALTPVSLRRPETVAHFLGWATAHVDGKSVEGPSIFAHDLQSMEDGAVLATAWLWLARRFPDVYRGEDKVREMVSVLNRRIEKSLVKTSGRKARRQTSKKAG